MAGQLVSGLAQADVVLDTLPELGRAFIDALGVLSIVAFILLGIRYGIFTPT